MKEVNLEINKFKFIDVDEDKQLNFLLKIDKKSCRSNNTSKNDDKTSIKKFEESVLRYLGQYSVWISCS